MKTTNGNGNGVSSNNSNGSATKKIIRTKSESISGFNIVNFNYNNSERKQQ